MNNVRLFFLHKKLIETVLRRIQIKLFLPAHTWPNYVKMLDCQFAN